jgi:two-component system, chemotaxis family, response regulator Rcp1
MKKTRQVLLVDDNPADLDLIADVLNRTKSQTNIHRVTDGVQAMAFLRQPGAGVRNLRPDVVLLDLNLPGKSGLEILREVKADYILQTIPIIMFSTSKTQKDICSSYKLGANCYMTKPGNLQDFVSVVTSFANLWLSCAVCPEREG